MFWHFISFPIIKMFSPCCRVNHWVHQTSQWNGFALIASCEFSKFCLYFSVPLTPISFKDDILYLYSNIFCNVLCMPLTLPVCMPLTPTHIHYTLVVCTQPFLCYWFLRVPCLFLANWCKWKSVALLFRRVVWSKDLRSQTHWLAQSQLCYLLGPRRH